MALLEGNSAAQGETMRRLVLQLELHLRCVLSAPEEQVDLALTTVKPTTSTSIASLG